MPEDTLHERIALGRNDDFDDEKVIREFGAQRLRTDSRYPELVQTLVRRGVLYAGRDVEQFFEAATEDQPHSIVTGVGPSGPMHIGHLLPLYVAREIQQTTDALVYIPLSDDEKYLTRDCSLEDIGRYTLANLQDIMAIGFDPDRTRIVIDTADADVLYPVASVLSKEVTMAQYEAIYGDPANIGQVFYPAVQATHLLLPQLVVGKHRTVVPIAADQDPHIRLCRDIAGKDRFPVRKPGGLISRFMPGLDGPGKMSSSTDVPSILLTDDTDTIREKIQKHAFTGGQATVQQHRERGGSPGRDVPFLLLYYFFERDDDRLEDVACKYENGALLSGELKQIAAETIADFLSAHQQRRPDEETVFTELPKYRLTAAERQEVLGRVGYTDLQSQISSTVPGD